MRREVIIELFVDRLDYYAKALRHAEKVTDNEALSELRNIILDAMERNQ